MQFVQIYNRYITNEMTYSVISTKTGIHF